MKLGLLLGATIALTSASAIADEADKRGWFAGAGLGGSSYDADEAFGSYDAGSLDSSDIVYTGFGGFRFNKNWGVQGNIFNLGKYGGGERVVRSVELDGISVTANGFLPLGDNGLEVYGRLGLAALTFTQNFSVYGTDIENSSTGSASVLAVGLAYTPVNRRNITALLEFTNYSFLTESVYTDEDEHSHSPKVLQVGVQFNF